LWPARLEFFDSGGAEEASKQLKQAIAKGWAIIDGGYADAFKTDSRLTSTSTPTP